MFHMVNHIVQRTCLQHLLETHSPSSKGTMLEKGEVVISLFIILSILVIIVGHLETNPFESAFSVKAFVGFGAV